MCPQILKLGKVEPRPIDINKVVHDFVKMITPQVKKEGVVEFQVEVGLNLPMVVADRVQLIEILMNFMLNSLHAVRQNEGRPKVVKLKIFDKNEVVRMEVMDNGYGVPSRLIEDIFLPSVTTKLTEGTGLGLYRVRKIVDGYKGKVWAQSQGKDKGATFIVELPVYKGEAPTQVQPPKVQRIRKLN